MNANLGIVLRKAERDKILSQLPPQIKNWAGEEIVVGKSRYVFPSLDKVEFEIYPITKFILSRLPASEQGEELEYAWMTGVGLDEYRSWLVREEDFKKPNAFEVSLSGLLNILDFWAVMLAPEGERLGEVVVADVDNLLRMLRRCVRDLDVCEGFLAVKA
ncbi:hypothetical protein [Ralstonia solanacearum]|uniref:Uncharacterized protein n=1 Tax=Ralstonia solanacearum TaxID=305 RepID=A0AAE3NH05_RALSL|nr:hypothetical protein [Ralstonia solanacearum]MBB6583675.1 hypothetical protein [Ralstonia solanacearum]MDB0521895.1 hypothetical protein [Ralstonia solanacearum]